MNKKDQNGNQSQKLSDSQRRIENKANEYAGFHFISSLKISDPKTGKILVQKRCD
jgi:hypothetical protein